MDFMEIIKKRYSVRKFDPKPVETEKIDSILQAVQLAPTACNYQSQRIRVISTSDDLKKLENCTPYHFHAPLALLVCYDNTKSWKRKFDEKDEGDIDASIIGTYIMLRATELGLGTTWVGSFDPVKIKEAYDLSDEIIPVALFPMGYPAESSEPSALHDARNPIKDMLL